MQLEIVNVPDFEDRAGNTWCSATCWPAADATHARPTFACRGPFFVEVDVVSMEMDQRDRKP